VALLRGQANVARRAATAALEGELRTSSITVFELTHGAAKSGRDNEFGKLRRFLGGRIQPVEFTPHDAEVAGRLRADLAARGEIIGAYDLLIAGQALAREWTVVTGNTREFARVRGLKLEDWTAAS
jgi:tRNA(fMet)-specific endonuclease VapC